MKSFINGAKRVAKDYSEHNIGRLSAEATYYIILSIVPFLIIALTAIPYFLVTIRTSSINFWLSYHRIHNILWKILSMI